MSSGEISILLRDRVPSRTIVYPIGAPHLNRELENVVALKDVALFFLYDSSAQVNYYDPAKSKLERYPILVVRQGLPEVTASVLAGDLAENPDVRSILVFPVKARLKQKVVEAIREQGIRPIVRWFSARPTPGSVQRPLVLIYDEAAQRVTAKFAEDWDGSELDRRYY